METVLITGASSGIGRELARCFAADGARLVLVARRAQRLHELANELKRDFGTESLVLPKDLSDPAAPVEIHQQLKADGVDVDVLVNNAGFGVLGRFSWGEPIRQVEMTRVNVDAVTHLTRLFISGMCNRNRGGILNVASTASFQPGPYMAVYYASKAYVRFLSEALAHELRSMNVTVSCLCPGPTETEFGDDSGMDQTLLFRTAMPAEKVARIGYDGFRRGKRIVIPGLLNRIGVYAARLSPPFIVRTVIGKLQHPSGNPDGSEER